MLELLHALGYGTSETDLQYVGGSGDAGIDGIISLDKLGFEKVGARLTSLMIEYGVGVTHRVIRLPRVDGDYFE